MTDRQRGPGDGTERVTDSGAWIWFPNPMAVRHAGAADRTYWTAVDAAGDILVHARDHDDGRVSSTTLRETGDVDDHHNGALFVRSDGRILAVYAVHEPVSPLYRRISEGPEDISSFGPEATVLDNGERHAYPNLAYLSAEDRLWLLYRDDGYETEYVTSPDEGATWSAPEQLLVTGENTADDRVYHKTATDGEQRIHVAVSSRVSGGDPHGVRYAYYEDGAFYASDGRRLAALDGGLPLAAPDLETVYDSGEPGHYPAWVWDVELDDDGYPVVAYAEIRSPSDHRYRCARFDGETWTDAEVAAGGVEITGGTQGRYSGGVAIDPTDPEVVYLSHAAAPDDADIQRWSTPDGGATWEKDRDVTADSHANVRPVVPDDRADAFGVLWMRGRYDDFTAYDTHVRVSGPSQTSGS